MNVRLFHRKDIKEDSVDVYYRNMTPQVEKIVEIAKGNQAPLHIYGENEKEEKVLLKIEDVYYFESVDKRTYAYLMEEVYQVQKSLLLLEGELKVNGFIRINKSNVVNIYKITCIKPELNMRVKANLENGEYLFINRSYKGKFEAYLKQKRGAK